MLFLFSLFFIKKSSSNQVDATNEQLIEGFGLCLWKKNNVSSSTQPPQKKPKKQQSSTLLTWFKPKSTPTIDGVARPWLDEEEYRMNYLIAEITRPLSWPTSSLRRHFMKQTRQ
jgi:hypothetical protein